MEEKKPVLYLNMILKEDEPVEMVKRSIDSVKDYIDGLYITITYKDEKVATSNPLVSLLNEYKAHISYFKWVDNFAIARQYALDQVPRGGHTYIYWQDADDVLMHAEKIPVLLQEADRDRWAAVYFPYWYRVQLDKNGDVKEVIISHKRERIIRNDDTFKWVGDLHETLIEQKQENLLRFGRDDCVVLHLSNHERGNDALERNIRILEKQATRELHKDPRTLIYLAKSYFDKGKIKQMPDRKILFDLALTLFHEYLEGAGSPGSETYQPPSGWREERGTAWGHIAEIAILSGHPEVAVGAYQNAIDEAYEFPNYYVDLAMAYCMLNDFKKAKHWLNLAAAMPQPNTTIIVFPRELRLRALQVSLEINMHEQKLDKALEDAKMILEITPDDESAKQNIETVEKLVASNKASQSLVFLGKYLELQQDKTKLAHLVQAIPLDLEREPFAAQMRHRFMPAKVWGEKEVTILCGPTAEKWSPKSVQTGIGGSEEAVIRLADELTGLGWKVTVYGDPREDAGIYKDVEYKQWYEINHSDSFNVLVLWRSIGFVDINPKAKFTMLWLHDKPNNPDFTEERVDKVDKIAVLSEYHKSILRMAKKGGVFAKMPDTKVFVTTNGIPNIDLEWKGNPHRIIYMSSPDRGLVYLLKNWSKVIKEVPDADLHIFYGFNVFDALSKGNPANQQWKQEIIKMMKQPGISYHGRVGHEALHYELSRTGIWAYPTDFEEISCISAMKAQACGAIPVVTNFAALEETVKNGVKVDVDIQTEEGQEEYTKALITALKNEEWQKDIRKNMMPWARKQFVWKDVAVLWTELFEVNIQNPEKKLEVK